MACQPTKCCCCAPLRPGLLAWAYIKLVLALTSIGAYSYVSRYEMSYMVDSINDRYSYRNPVFYILEVMWPLGVCLLYLVFTIIFIIGVHRENIKLLIAYLVYSIVEVILAGAAFGAQVYGLVDKISYYSNYNYEPYGRTLHHYLNDPLLYVRLIIPIVVNIILPIYFMVLIKSEIQRLKSSRGETRTVLDNPVTKKQDRTYNFVYSYETADLRKPVFPVGELERLRQQLGVKNV